MRMKPLATALAALATIATAGAAHAGDGPFTANVGLVSRLRLPRAEVGIRRAPGAAGRLRLRP